MSTIKLALFALAIQMIVWLAPLYLYSHGW